MAAVNDGDSANANGNRILVIYNQQQQSDGSENNNLSSNNKKDPNLTDYFLIEKSHWK